MPERTSTSPTTQVIILNGPMGVGKTTAARALVDRLAPALFLDADHVADFRPFDVREAEHLNYIEDTLRHMVAFHTSHGFRRLVIAWVFETADRLGDFSERLRSQGHAVHAFRLTCDAREHEARVRARDRDNLAWELVRHRELAQGFEAAAARGSLGRTIDTTDMSPEEVADAVADLLGL